MAKAEFSNSKNTNIQKWQSYIKGSAIRQEFLECALDWVGRGNISDYMSKNRHNNNIDELKAYFTSVIDWVSTLFINVEKEMIGLNWGDLYERYKTTAYNPTKISDDVKRLYADPYVKNRKGIFEYILGGETDTRLLDVRIFDDAIKRKAYALQTNDANAKSISNCPLCANGNNANKTKIYSLKEMDADHVQAWSKGGATNIENCEMLCITHNRSKGNR